MDLSNRIVNLSSFKDIKSDCKVRYENLDPSQIKLGVINDSRYPNKTYYKILYGRFPQTLTLEAGKYDYFDSYGFKENYEWDDNEGKYTNELAGGWSSTIKIFKNTKFEQAINMIRLEVFKLLTSNGVIDAKAVMDRMQLSYDNLTIKDVDDFFGKIMRSPLKLPKNKDKKPDPNAKYYYLGMKTEVNYVNWDLRHKGKDGLKLDMTKYPKNIYPKVKFKLIEDRKVIHLNRHNAVDDLDKSPNDTWLGLKGYSYRVKADIFFDTISCVDGSFFMKPFIKNGTWKRKETGEEEQAKEIDDEELDYDPFANDTPAQTKSKVVEMSAEDVSSLL